MFLYRNGSIFYSSSISVCFFFCFHKNSNIVQFAERWFDLHDFIQQFIFRASFFFKKVRVLFVLSTGNMKCYQIKTTAGITVYF